jgi:WD40 repeat protein
MVTTACSDGYLRVTDPDANVMFESAEHTNPVTRQYATVYSCEFSRDCSEMFTTAEDGILRLFNVPSREAVAAGGVGGAPLLIRAVAISDDLEDGEFLGTYNADCSSIFTVWSSGMVRTFDAGNGDLIWGSNVDRASFVAVTGRSTARSLSLSFSRSLARSLSLSLSLFSASHLRSCVGPVCNVH